MYWVSMLQAWDKEKLLVLDLNSWPHSYLLGILTAGLWRQYMMDGQCWKSLTGFGDAQMEKNELSILKYFPSLEVHLSYTDSCFSPQN